MNNESAQPDEGTVSPGRPYDSAAIDRARLAAQEAAISPTSVPGAVSGAIIGKRYKLLEPIGEGGMGVVWMAEQRSPIRRIVAIKLIKAGMDSSAILARFSAERQALAMMDHPNIARIFDGGTSEQGHPFFVMELVKGLPLTRYCDERKMPLHERLDLFVQVCGAVQHAHQKGIIHRDLKPANLLVTEHDGKPIAKVIDFGLAKALGGSAVLTDRTLHTSFGAAAGTPQYMAPEQVAINALDIDTRADVYALGVILYELLAGSTPHDVSGLHQAAWDEIRRVIREVDPPRPSLRITQSKTLVNLAATRHIEPARLGKLIAGDLDWIVMKALEKDRHRRYGSVSDLAADLQRHLAGDPVLAAPPTVAYRLQKFTRKYKVALSTAATILMVLMAGVLLSTWQAIRARRAENFARRQTTEANNQKTEADRQKADAQRQRATADEANSKAVDEAKKVQRQLADSYVQNGISAWAEHDPSLAALWFAKALKIDQGDPHDPHRELMDRIRLGDSFRHCAWPTIVAQDEANRVRVKDDDITTLTMRKERDGTLTVVSPHGTRITLDSSVTRVTEAGNVLLAAKRGSVQLWDGVTGKALSPSLQAPGDSTSLIRLGRNHRFVTMSLNSDRGIWDTHTGEALSLNGVSVFDELIYSADRSLIAFKDGGRAQVWSIETLKQVGVSGDVPEQLYRMNEHGQVILYWDAFLRVWDPFSGTYAGPRFTTDYQYFDNLISVSPDGKRATLRKDASRLSLFDACTGTELCDFESFTFHDESPRFSNDGRWIYSRDLRWDTRLLSPPDPLIRKAHDTGGYFCLNGDGSMLASWGNDSGLRIWNIDKLQPVAPVASDLMEGQWNLRFMPGTDELIALSNDDDEQWHLAVCSLSNGRIVRSSARIKHAPRTYVSMRSVSPDGAYVLVTYHTQSLGDWTEGVFSTKNLNQVAVIAQGGSLPTLRFSPDGRALIAVGFGGIGAWDVATGKNISSPPSGWRAFAAPGVLCPDGKSCLTSGDPSGTRAELRIRALENGEALTPPFATTNHIGLSEYDLSHSLGFNGAVVCTPLDDSIRLWDARSTIAVTSKLSCDSNTIAAGICSDGTSVLSVSGSDNARYTLRRWSIAPVKLGSDECELLAELISGRGIDRLGGIAQIDEQHYGLALKALRRLERESPDLLPRQTPVAPTDVLPSYRDEVNARLAAAQTEAQKKELAREWGHASGMEIKSRLYNEAALLAEKSLSLDDSSLAAKDHLAHAYTCLGRFSEALKIYQPYAGRVYKTAGPWAEMGTVAGDLTDLAEIWPDGNDDPSYRQIVALAAPKPTTQPSSDDLARNFGQKAIDDFHLGHKQDSYDALRNALRISKKPGLTADTGILLTSAQSLIDPPSTQPSDDFADGLQQAAWAILKNPDQTADRYAKALDFARRSVAQHQTPANLSVLGAALYRTGELQAAIESLAKSDAADFVMRDYHVRNLAFTAMAQKRLGHEAEARAALQTIVDISRELDALVDDDFPCFNEAAAMIDPATTRPSTLPAEDSLVVKPAGELKGPPATQPADTPSDGKANFSRMAVYQFKLGHREYAKELLLKAWSAGESGLPRENPDAPLFESAWSLIDPHHGKPKNVYADGLNNAASAIASFPGKSEARYAEALDLARQAVSADDDPSNINTLGLAQYRAGDFKGAIVSLSRSNELDLFQDLRYSNAIYCAMALERLGKHGEAKATLSAAIKAQQYLDRDDPDDVGEDDARAVIEAARLILSPEEWFAIRFDAGYWPFSFGATPADTVAAIRKPWDTHWTDLRVAREYSGHDVRYVVVPINEVTMSTFGVDAVSKYSYACLLFEDGKLFKIALRFLNDAKVKDHQAVFDAVARSFGMDPADIADGQRITARSQRVMLEGTRNSHGTFIEFSLIDSPKPQGSEVVRLGIMPPPPVTQPAAEKPVVERPADETPAIRLKALDRPHPSAPNGARTTITFVNRSANEVQLFWLDTENTRHLLFGIAPGARLLEHSFVGHVFLVLGSDNSVRGVFEAIKDPAEAIIDGAGATTRPTTLPATLPAADPTTAPANRSN